MQPLRLATGSPTQRLGAQVERRAAQWIAAQGLEVIGCNLAWRGGELDLIARDAEQVVFFEVRARTSNAYGGAAASLSWQKRRRIIRSAQLWLLRTYGQAPWPQIRFDVLLTTSTSESAMFEWVRAAFDGSGQG
jgi:putative endonuclease